MIHSIEGMHERQEYIYLLTLFDMSSPYDLEPVLVTAGNCTFVVDTRFAETTDKQLSYIRAVFVAIMKMQISKNNIFRPFCVSITQIVIMRSIPI